MALFLCVLSTRIKICSFHNWLQYLIFLKLIYNICANFWTELHYQNQWIMKHNYFSQNAYYESNTESFSRSVLFFKCLDLFFEIESFAEKELKSYVSMSYFCLSFFRCFVLLNTLVFQLLKTMFFFSLPLCEGQHDEALPVL